MHSFTDFLRIVSHPAWGGGVSLRQETISEWFPIRRGTKVIRSDGKLFAYSFLLNVGQRGFIAAGNYLRMVSYSTWNKGDSSRQETVCE